MIDSAILDSLPYPATNGLKRCAVGAGRSDGPTDDRQSKVNAGWQKFQCADGSCVPVSCLIALSLMDVPITEDLQCTLLENEDLISCSVADAVSIINGYVNPVTSRNTLGVIIKKLKAPAIRSDRGIRALARDKPAVYLVRHDQHMVVWDLRDHGSPALYESHPMLDHAVALTMDTLRKLGLQTVSDIYRVDIEVMNGTSKKPRRTKTSRRRANRKKGVTKTVDM